MLQNCIEALAKGHCMVAGSMCTSGKQVEELNSRLLVPQLGLPHWERQKLVAILVFFNYRWVSVPGCVSA